MNIYIPKNLLEIPVIKQMVDMLSYYSENVKTEEKYPFQYYNNSQIIDPVKEFIELCISSQSYPETQDKENISNYLTRLFYSVKGTVKVFELMETYLGISFIGEVTYNTEFIEFGIDKVLVDNEELFYQLLVDFLNSLLYFRELRVSSSTTDLLINGNISNSIGSGISVFNKITIDTIYEN